jgi:hypothetical protein
MQVDGSAAGALACLEQRGSSSRKAALRILQASQARIIVTDPYHYAEKPAGKFATRIIEQ